MNGLSLQAEKYSRGISFLGVLLVILIIVFGLVAGIQFFPRQILPGYTASSSIETSSSVDSGFSQPSMTTSSMTTTTTVTSVSLVLGATDYVARIFQGNDYTLTNTQSCTTGTSANPCVSISNAALDLASLARSTSEPYFHELIYFGIPQVVSSSGSISLSPSVVSGWNTIVDAIKSANPSAEVGVMLSLGSTSGTNIQSSAAVTALQNINALLAPKPDLFDFDFAAQTPSNVQTLILNYLQSTGQLSSGWSGSNYAYGKAVPGQPLQGSGNFVGHFVTTIPSASQENCVGFATQPESVMVSDIQSNSQSQTSTIRFAYPVAQAWCAYATSWWAFDYPSVLMVIP